MSPGWRLLIYYQVCYSFWDFWVILMCNKDLEPMSSPVSTCRKNTESTQPILKAFIGSTTHDFPSTWAKAGHMHAMHPTKGKKSLRTQALHGSTMPYRRGAQRPLCSISQCFPFCTGPLSCTVALTQAQLIKIFPIFSLPRTRRMNHFLDLVLSGLLGYELQLLGASNNTVPGTILRLLHILTHLKLKNNLRGQHCSSVS